MSIIKLCVDCKWYKEVKDGPLFAKTKLQMCRHPRFKSMVDGTIENKFCIFERDSDLLGTHCGESGKYWEPKP